MLVAFIFNHSFVCVYACMHVKRIWATMTIYTYMQYMHIYNHTYIQVMKDEAQDVCH